MASINNTPRPAYVYDTATNEWIPIGVGAHNHNEITKGVIPNKGDLVAGIGQSQVDRVAVGSNGSVLVADNTQTTGMAWAGPLFTAGKNKIINGDFGIWQRGTSVNLTASTETFLADRFVCYMDSNAGTVTYSRQTFTPGTAPVSGYEGTYFARLSTGGNGNFSMFYQRIEDVRTFAGQTITVSFWMKSSTAKTFTILVRQDFGSGGSSVVDQSTTYTTTTSWARYSATFTLGSLSGKTIGTGSSLLIQPVSYGAQTGNFTVDIWGVQLEAGSTATPFQTATGTIQGELAACQRYYAKSYAQGTAPQTNTTTGIRIAYLGGTTVTNGFLVTSNQLPVVMRGAPTVTVYSQGGTAGSFTNIASGSDSGANTGVALYITDASFAIYNNSGGNLTGGNGGVSYHYVASAEL